MENEILSALNEIKTAIYLLLAVVIIGVVANWVRTGISIKNVIRKELDDIFIVEASNYFEKGLFDELLSHCENHLKTKPNHSHALWYKAKAYYQKNEYQKSKACFELLSKSEPSWNESYVQPYLQQIEAIERENR